MTTEETKTIPAFIDFLCTFLVNLIPMMKVELFGTSGGQLIIPHGLPGLEPDTLAAKFDSFPEVVRLVNEMYLDDIGNERLSQLSHKLTQFLAEYKSNESA